MDGFPQTGLLRLLKQKAWAAALLLLALCPALSLAGEPTRKQLDMGDIASALRQAAKGDESITLPDDSGAGNEAAGAVMERFRSPAYQTEIRTEQERLQQELFRDKPAAPAPEQTAGPGQLGPEERVYLFVSSSVPLATLRTYAAMLDRTNDPNLVMVLRGLVGGMKEIRPTLEFVSRIINRDPACDMASGKCPVFDVNLQVDPRLFSRYGVNEVPTVVFAAGVPTDPLEEQPPQSFWAMSGDAGLDWQLERINREAKSESLAGLIAALRQGNGGSHDRFGPTPPGLPCRLPHRPGSEPGFVRGHGGPL